jgi:hypothetical protein
MPQMPKWLDRTVSTIRALGAGYSVWTFLGSPTAAVYIWGPLLAIWALIAGWKEAVPTPYLLATCALTFGAVIWCFFQAHSAIDRFREKYQKLQVIYDRSVPSCRADVTFKDGSHSMCFRLRVENSTNKILRGCEGWLESTDQFPNIGSVELFWTGMPEEKFSVDLIKGVPRFLQICRITDQDRVTMATPGEAWPIDSLKAFQPGSQYVFRIALKGDDLAETTFYSVRLKWTGNWTTAEMAAVQ